MRSWRSTPPVRRCSPGAAEHAVASGEHGRSVAVAQVLEGRGMGNHMPMRLQGVLALCVCFVYWQIGHNSREIHTNFVRISRE